MSIWVFRFEGGCRSFFFVVIFVFRFRESFVFWLECFRERKLDLAVVRFRVFLRYSYVRVVVAEWVVWGRG